MGDSGGFAQAIVEISSLASVKAGLRADIARRFLDLQPRATPSLSAADEIAVTHLLTATAESLPFTIDVLSTERPGASPGEDWHARALGADGAASRPMSLPADAMGCTPRRLPLSAARTQARLRRHRCLAAPIDIPGLAGLSRVTPPPPLSFPPLCPQ